jgi:hypothetical protein
MKRYFKQTQPQANLRGAMETGDHSKNGASPKSLMSRENPENQTDRGNPENRQVMKTIIKIGGTCFIILLMLLTAGSMANAQTVVDTTEINSGAKAPSHAELTKHKHLWWGLKAGANLSSIEDNIEWTGYNKSSKWNFSAGIVMEYNFTEWLAIQPEILYSPKGFVLSEELANPDHLWFTPLLDNQTGIERKNNFEIYYIELPVNIVFKTPVGINIGGGAYLSYALWGKNYITWMQNGKQIGEDYIANHASDYFHNYVPDNDEYNELGDLREYMKDKGYVLNEKTDLMSGENKFLLPFDWGINVIAEYRIPCGVFFGARYAKGMNNILENKDEYLKNSTFNFYIGVKL